MALHGKMVFATIAASDSCCPTFPEFFLRLLPPEFRTEFSWRRDGVEGMAPAKLSIPFEKASIEEDEEWLSKRDPRSSPELKAIIIIMPESYEGSPGTDLLVGLKDGGR